MQALSTRVIRRVRALVVLPTHDLAQQVAAVMRTVCGAVQLDVGVVAGKGSLRPEADALVRYVSLVFIPTQPFEPSLYNSTGTESRGAVLTQGRSPPIRLFTLTVCWGAHGSGRRWSGGVGRQLAAWTCWWARRGASSRTCAMRTRTLC